MLYNYNYTYWLIDPFYYPTYLYHWNRQIGVEDIGGIGGQVSDDRIVNKIGNLMQN